MLTRSCWSWLAALAVLVAGPGTLVAADPPQGHGGAAVGEHGDADHHAGHGEGGHGHIGTHGVSEDPSSDPEDPDLAIYTFIVFLLLVGILSKFAWGPVVRGLDKREQKIAENIALAQRSADDARRMLAEYEAKLSAAADEVRAILDEARRDAEHTQQEILARARADAQAEMSRAKREVETAKDQAIKELAETAANQAVLLAEKVLRTQLAEADHKRLIAEAMAGFPQGDGRNN